MCIVMESSRRQWFLLPLIIMAITVYVLSRNMNKNVDTQTLNWKTQRVLEKKETVDRLANYTVPKWVADCKDVYMDLGSNIGVQIKKLFEPEKYPTVNRAQKTVMDLYDEEFGTPEKRKMNDSGLCVLGFEPNPKHHERLKRIETHYLRKGWKVHFFPYAVSDEDKFVTFFTKDNSEATEDWGASLLWPLGGGQVHPHTVQSISLPRFLQTHLPRRQIKLVKMDIEGEEYNLLPDLLVKELLCKDIMKTILLEIHPAFFRSLPWSLFYKSPQELLTLIADNNACAEGPTTILQVDDESYLHDVE